MGVLCHNPLQAPRYQFDLMLQKVRLVSWCVATASSLKGRDMGMWLGGRTGLMPSSHSHRAELTVSLLETLQIITPKNQASGNWKIWPLLLSWNIGTSIRHWACSSSSGQRSSKSGMIRRRWGGEYPWAAGCLLVASKSSEINRAYGRFSTLQHKNNYKNHLIPLRIAVSITHCSYDTFCLRGIRIKLWQNFPNRALQHSLMLKGKLVISSSAGKLWTITRCMSSITQVILMFAWGQEFPVAAVIITVIAGRCICSEWNEWSDECVRNSMAGWALWAHLHSKDSVHPVHTSLIF